MGFSIIQACINSVSPSATCHEWEYTFSEPIVLIFYFALGFFIFFKVLTFVYDFTKKQ